MSFRELALERPVGQRPAVRTKRDASTKPIAQRSSAGQRATGPLLLTPSPSARQQLPYASRYRASSAVGGFSLVANVIHHSHDRTRKVMTFFPYLPPVWDACSHFAPSAVTLALDALLLRNVEATTTQLIATSHNAGRPLTLCSRTRSECAGGQVEKVLRLADGTGRRATKVPGLALHGQRRPTNTRPLMADMAGPARGARLGGLVRSWPDGRPSREPGRWLMMSRPCWPPG